MILAKDLYSVNFFVHDGSDMLKHSSKLTFKLVVEGVVLGAPKVAFSDSAKLAVRLTMFGTHCVTTAAVAIIT